MENCHDEDGAAYIDDSVVILPNFGPQVLEPPHDIEAVPRVDAVDVPQQQAASIHLPNQAHEHKQSRYMLIYAHT
jgi:hypothetical protein